MKRKLFIIIVTMIPFIGIAQQIDKGKYLEEISNNNLQEVQKILFDYAAGFFTLENGKLWQQIALVDERQDLIICKTRLADDSLLNEWKVVRQIPILRIDTIYHSFKEGTVTFVTNYRLAQMIKDSEVPNNLLFTFNARVGKIRNISWQIWKKIDDYKKEKLKKLTARETINEAVLQYLFDHQYNSLQVKNILNDKKLFVGKCNICSGTQDALSDYISAITISKATSDDLSDSLINNNHDTKMRAMELLVNRAINNYYVYKGFSEEQILKSQTDLEAERKRSMNMTNSKKCASCDGACIKL